MKKRKFSSRIRIDLDLWFLWNSGVWSGYLSANRTYLSPCLMCRLESRPSRSLLLDLWAAEPSRRTAALRAFWTPTVTKMLVCIVVVWRAAHPVADGGLVGPHTQKHTHTHTCTAVKRLRKHTMCRLSSQTLPRRVTRTDITHSVTNKQNFSLFLSESVAESLLSAVLTCTHTCTHTQLHGDGALLPPFAHAPPGRRGSGGFLVLCLVARGVSRGSGGSADPTATINHLSSVFFVNMDLCLRLETTLSLGLLTAWRPVFFTIFAERTWPKTCENNQSAMFCLSFSWLRDLRRHQLLPEQHLWPLRPHVDTSALKSKSQQKSQSRRNIWTLPREATAHVLRRKFPSEKCPSGLFLGLFWPLKPHFIHISWSKSSLWSDSEILHKCTESLSSEIKLGSFFKMSRP